MYIIVNIFVNTQSILTILALKRNGLNALSLRKIITTMFRGFAKLKKSKIREKLGWVKPQLGFLFFGDILFFVCLFVLFPCFKLVGGAWPIWVFLELCDCF